MENIDWNGVDADQIPASKIQNNSFVQELKESAKLAKDLESEVTLPYSIGEVTLMSPGVWNNYQYTPEAIKKAFRETDWKSSDNKSLFWDHEDEASEKWIGEIKNPRLKNNKIVGDLEIVDKEAAIKLAYGAKFGVSPKVTGDAKGNKMLDFGFDNFSVVLNPAVKTAYINNSQNKLEVKNVSEKDEGKEEEVKEENKEKPEDEKKKPEDEEEKENQEDEKVEEVEEEESQEDINEKILEQVEKKLENFKEELKKEYPYPYKKDEEEEEENKEVDSFKEFVEEKKKESPEMSFEEISKEYSQKQKSPEEIINEVKSEMSDRINELEEKVTEKNDKIEELEEKTEEPDRVTATTGKKSQELRDKLEDMEDDEVDAVMSKRFLANQGDYHG